MQSDNSKGKITSQI